MKNFNACIYNRRIAKTVDLDGAGAGVAVTERYVYDRDHIMLVFVGANLKERYLYGANLDQVLAVEGTQVSWTLSDYLGTVRDLVSSAGVVQNHIKYDSFGNVTAQSAPTVKSRFGFTGRELDTETGLYYYRARYYDSTVGRFLSEDPIIFAGGDANLSRYVFNSPVNAIDPSGKELEIPWQMRNTWSKKCQLLDMIINAITGVVTCRYTCIPWGPKDTIRSTLDDPTKKCPQWFDFVPDPVPGESSDENDNYQQCVVPLEPNVLAPNFTPIPPEPDPTPPSQPAPTPSFPNFSFPEIQIPPIPCLPPFCNPFERKGI